LVKEDNMRISVLLAFIITLVACSAQSMRGNFEMSINQYSELVRKHNLDAASLFTTEALAEEFRARVKAAKNMRVVDYRIVGTKYYEEKGEAEAQVEIDYYTLATYRLKTLVDVQKWAYLDEGGKKQWRLTSLLPEFR